MDETGFSVFLVTAASKEEAGRIAARLLEERKAACVNILPGVQSSYWWQGKIESASEVLLIIKSRTSLAEDVIRVVKDSHSYSVPEVIALPVVAGNPDYLAWIGHETKIDLPGEGES